MWKDLRRASSAESHSKPAASKELDSASTLNEPGSEFFPRAPRQELRLADTLVSGCKTLSRKL